MSALVTGYRLDFGWIFDADFDEQGFPMHQGGVAAEQGLYFVGLPWLTTRGSSFIPGLRPDAERIVAHMAARADSRDPRNTKALVDASIGQSGRRLADRDQAPAHMLLATSSTQRCADVGEGVGEPGSRVDFAQRVRNIGSSAPPPCANVNAVGAGV